MLQSEPPQERVYEPKGVGVTLKKGDEVRINVIMNDSSFSFYFLVHRRAKDPTVRQLNRQTLKQGEATPPHSFSKLKETCFQCVNGFSTLNECVIYQCLLCSKKSNHQSYVT